MIRAVAGLDDAVLQAALERLAEADILLVHGVPTDSEYRFRHALIRDVAYENLLKSRRQVLHQRVGEALRDRFATTAAAEPELLAHHFTQAGLREAAIEWWGKAGQRSLARSALVEAAEQLTQALSQIETLTPTPALRREQIKLQVALIHALTHAKGHAAAETKAAVERARLLIEQAEALGEPPEDPLLLFSVLFSFWVAHHVAFNGDAMRHFAAQFLVLAEKQGAIAPLMIAHRIMGISLTSTGDIVDGKAHLDRAIALYDPAAHRPLATLFAVDARVSILSFRSRALWMLGYPEAAIADTDQGVTDARQIGHAATLTNALGAAGLTQILCGDYAAAIAQSDELVALADKKLTVFRKALGMMNQGCVSILTGKASDAVQMITSGIALRSTDATLWMPWFLSHLAIAYAELTRLDDAWRCIGEAMTVMETTKERWCEAEVNRMAGEIALKAPEPSVAKAETYFERALAVARKQQAKSWELRAAMSMARLWRDQGERDEARELLAPVYGWFTEGFETLDLKEAKVLLGELAG
jgi:predicted ATPase